MQRILITGANGFVGSHVLEASHAIGDAQWIAAVRDRNRLPAGYRGEVRCGDLRDREYCREVVRDVDVVIHTAAWTSLWGRRELSQRHFLQPGLQLLEAAVDAGVGRFVFLSSTSVTRQQDRGDPLKTGMQPAFWPHLSHVVMIENRMRELAGSTAMVNLRCGLFAGAHYNLGLLPILLPRLKTHLVPWVEAGRTSMPIVAGEDLGQAFVRAATATGLDTFESFQIVGPEVPTARQVIEFLHSEYNYPLPHFSVPFPLGYAFAWVMEQLDRVVPWEPLVVRSIIHLLEETWPDNSMAMRRLGYRPEVNWQRAIRIQVDEMKVRQKVPMRTAVPLR